MQNKQITTIFLLLISILTLGQNKHIELISLTYSPNIIIGQSYTLPFYQKVEADIRLFDKATIKFSQGLFSATYGANENRMSFVSQTGITQALDLNITPIRTKRFRVHVGLGLAYMYYKDFKTYMTNTITYGDDEEFRSYRYHYLINDNQSKLGIDFYTDFELVVTNHFALSAAANAMAFKSSLNKDYGNYHFGLNLVYYIDNQLKE